MDIPLPEDPPPQINLGNIPIPEDINRYSPSVPIEDDPSDSKTDLSDIALPSSSPSSKSDSTPSKVVLGKSAAKKRLLAFSMAKLNIPQPKKSKIDDEKLLEQLQKKKLKKCVSDKARDTISEIEELKRQEKERESLQTTVFPLWTDPDDPDLLLKTDPHRVSTVENMIETVLKKTENDKRHRYDRRNRRDNHEDRRERRDREEKNKDEKEPQNWDDFNLKGLKVYHYRRHKYKYEKDDDPYKKTKSEPSKKVNLLDTPKDFIKPLLVIGNNDERKEFPSWSVKHTTSRPSVSFSLNPNLCKYHTITRAEMMETLPDDILQTVTKFLQLDSFKSFKPLPKSHERKKFLTVPEFLIPTKKTTTYKFSAMYEDEIENELNLESKWDKDDSNTIISTDVIKSDKDDDSIEPEEVEDFQLEKEIIDLKNESLTEIDQNNDEIQDKSDIEINLPVSVSDTIQVYENSDKDSIEKNLDESKDFLVQNQVNSENLVSEYEEFMKTIEENTQINDTDDKIDIQPIEIPIEVQSQVLPIEVQPIEIKPIEFQEQAQPIEVQPQAQPIEVQPIEILPQVQPIDETKIEDNWSRTTSIDLDLESVLAPNWAQKIKRRSISLSSTSSSSSYSSSSSSSLSSDSDSDSSDTSSSSDSSSKKKKRKSKRKSKKKKYKKAKKQKRKNIKKARDLLTGMSFHFEDDILKMDHTNLKNPKSFKEQLIEKTLFPFKRHFNMDMFDKSKSITPNVYGIESKKVNSDDSKSVELYSPTVEEEESVKTLKTPSNSQLDNSSQIFSFGVNSASEEARMLDIPLPPPVPKENPTSFHNILQQSPQHSSPKPGIQIQLKSPLKCLSFGRPKLKPLSVFSGENSDSDENKKDDKNDSDKYDSLDKKDKRDEYRKRRDSMERNIRRDRRRRRSRDRNDRRVRRRRSRSPERRRTPERRSPRRRNFSPHRNSRNRSLTPRNFPEVPNNNNDFKNEAFEDFKNTSPKHKNYEEKYEFEPKPERRTPSPYIRYFERITSRVLSPRNRSDERRKSYSPNSRRYSPDRNHSYSPRRRTPRQSPRYSPRRSPNAQYRKIRTPPYSPRESPRSYSPRRYRNSPFRSEKQSPDSRTPVRRYSPRRRSISRTPPRKYEWNENSEPKFQDKRFKMWEKYPKDFQTSLADSTISDSELIKETNSPKRVSLDERLKMELGDNFEGKSQMHQNENYVYYYDNHHFNQPRSHYPPAAFVKPIKINTSVPPPTWNQMQEPVTKIVQVGNVLQVVPSELPVIQPVQPIQPIQPQKEESVKVVQVGNVLEVVPLQIPSAPPPLPKSLPIPPPVAPVLPVLIPEITPEPLVAKSPEPPKAITIKSLPLPPQSPDLIRKNEERQRRKEEKENRKRKKEAKAARRMLRKALLKEKLAAAEEQNASEIDNIENVHEPVKTVILDPPDKGILLTLGFGGLNQEKRKTVSFADGIKPGEGTSPSGGEDHPLSPPPNVRKTVRKKRKKRKVKVRKTTQDDEDELYEMSPPPPPPSTPPFEAYYDYTNPSYVFQPPLLPNIEENIFTENIPNCVVSYGTPPPHTALLNR